MKKLTLLFLFLYIGLYGYGQLHSRDYKTTVINKKVKEFPLKINLSTPFDSYLSREYVMVSGQQRLWYEISTYEFLKYFDPQAPDKKVSEETQETILNAEIKEMVVYKDSVAAVLTYNPAHSIYYINSSRLEEGKWVNTGQDMGKTIEKCREKLLKMMPNLYKTLSLIARYKKIPQDSKPFLDYLKKGGQSPEDFMLTTLAEHKIVVYGEYHRRRPSWDLLKSLIRNPQFAKTTGTVFMELPSHMQSVMDQFFAQKEMDTELLLQIFREEQPYGWWSKDQYEFLTELWKQNRPLKSSKKINVILVDFQIAYSRIKTKEEMENYPQIDRNLHMANVIENYVKHSKDKRHHLFIVGVGHAYKSNVPGRYSTPAGQERQLTAGAQLVRRFPANEVFTLFQHVVTSDNTGNHKALIRHGFFDRVFEEAGNKPVAFNLKGSPFGAEPFDGLSENLFEEESGSYENNFDGYIFLQPLKEELAGRILYELFTDRFVEEMKRRSVYLGNTDHTFFWFGRKATDLTAEYIKKVLRNEQKGEKKYTEALFK